MNKIKKVINYIIPIPFLLNFLLNLLDSQFTINHLNKNSFIVSFVCFIFLINIGKLISFSLNIKNVSLCIAIFFMSFFVFNFSTLFFDKTYLKFDNYFFIVTFLWAIFFLYNYKNINVYNFLISIISLSIVHILNNNTQSLKLGYKELSTDTNYFWTPMSKLIYENDLFYALENNIIPGYGLLVNYIHALNFKIFFNYEYFAYIPVTSNIFFFLGLYFIYELRFEIHIKLSTLLIYISILLNSDWLSYLFFNSTMGEVVVNFLFSIFFLAIFSSKRLMKESPPQRIKFLLVFICGFLYFLKPFASYLIIISIVIFFTFKKDILSIAIGLIGLLLNYINYYFLISQNAQDGYLNSSEISGIGNFTNLNFKNINLIFKDFYQLDKVITLLLFILFILSLFNLWRFRYFTNSSFVILINILFVFYLYISIWQDKELESAYRYILSFLNLFFFLYIDQINKVLGGKDINL
jgi:hypothetical protein